MTGLRRFFSVWLIVMKIQLLLYHCAVTMCRSTQQKSTPAKRLLIVTFDGFRWDFLQRLPKENNFTRISKSGIWASHGLETTFVTKDFPNYYSMVTGLYEETNGIVASEFWDPQYGQVINIKHTDAENKKDVFLGNPIWTTYIQRRGQDLVGCYMWAGCRFDIQGIKLQRSPAYDIKVSWEDRVSTVVDWFNKDGIELGLLYFHEPDYPCHGHGPESDAATQMIQTIDAYLGYLLNKLSDNHLDDVNLLVVSNHGFTSVVGWATVIPNDDLFIIRVQKDNFWHIWPVEGKKEETVAYLKKFPHATVYTKDEIPSSWHYSQSDRIPPIFLLADYGWCLLNSQSPPPYFEKGVHGYDNSVHEMWPIFMAKGPSFKAGAEVPADFNLLDIYDVMSLSLGLHPQPNNGSLSRAQSIMNI
jgi:ectonucleotide pyrophosphatase/phosphodiesterase family protein 5